MSRYPSLYQVNTRVWMTELSRQLGRRATLDDAPDAELERWAEAGFDWIWLLGVWQTGDAGRKVSLSNSDWRREFEDTLSDLDDADIAGSCFAVTGYAVHRKLGGNPALARLRERLQRHGLRLMLDFVPNHVALDHPWVARHPDYFVAGTDEQLANQPQNYCRLPTPRGDQVFAHGRDPYFSGWPDTVQLNYGNPELQTAMIRKLAEIATKCDGVRCDMAMLILPDIFERTWGIRAAPFWPRAIEQVRRKHPEFIFLGEVYWDLEWTLQQEGFDFTYDKRLYDRLRDRHAGPVRDHLRAELDFQDKLARFLENHDEPRAAATFDVDVHQAAAILTYLAPGLRFFHQGQLEGRLKRISPHLARAPDEPLHADLQQFYARLRELLKRPILRDGVWWLVECVPAWEGNSTCDDVVACTWEAAGEERLLVVVNFADHPSQCHVRFPFALQPGMYRLSDAMSDTRYDRDLAAADVFLNLSAWQYHVFELERLH